MTNTTARMKQKGKHFEIIVDLDRALTFKKTGVNGGFLEIDRIFTDHKKGLHASSSDLNEAFGTEDVDEISKKIVKSGEILLTQEHRDEEKEKKFKQVIDFLSRNALNPQTKLPHTPERIKTALEQSKINIKNVPIENQIQDIISALNPIIPIKIETKKVKLLIPSIHTGKAYGIVSAYKENESWLPNGDLEIVVNVPAGMIIDFYDKLNSATHGSVLSEEVRE